MPLLATLFNKRILKNSVDNARWEGVTLPAGAQDVIRIWSQQLERGALDRLTESQIEQSFNSQIFGKVLGYKQIGEGSEASLLRKTTGSSGRDTPDFVLGRFDPAARVADWAAVAEVKDTRTDLDQPQLGRKNKETPVEQAFRYALKGKPGIEWILVSNFREIRLYKNGYSNAYYSWDLLELNSDPKLFEFYSILRPEALINFGTEPFTLRLFKNSVSAGHALAEGFYGLYKLIQQKLIQTLVAQPISQRLSIAELYGNSCLLRTNDAPIVSLATNFRK